MNLKFIAGLLFLTNATLFNINAFSQEPIEPIKPVQTINLAQVELGKKLFLILVSQNQVLSSATFALPIIPHSTDKTPQPKLF